MTKYIVFALMLSMGLVQCTSNAFAAVSKRSVQTVRPKTQTKASADKASRSLIAKLKAQALNEARAEVAAENELRERARLEALEEIQNSTVEESEASDAE